MKRILSAILISEMIIAVVRGYGSPKERPLDSDENHYYLYFKDSATAIFFNSDSEDHDKIGMTAYSEDSDSRTFCSEGSTALAAYGMTDVYFHHPDRII